MAAINDLINQIENEELRARIQQEAEKLFKNKKFGLVFEEHLPECTPLYDIPIKRGSSVAVKTGKISDIYIVRSIKDGIATCVSKSNREQLDIPIQELVCVAEFGEAIYPYLKPIDSICNAPESDLWHTLIEADNYHALQLLEYLYAGKVDCIYIDPPYNTGAKDWKYNNDYVDETDAYRHSKWLSFMEKRLKIAKKLLNPNDSVLIVTIDEKEYLHLGCLLEEIFPDSQMQMVSITINPSGAIRENMFSRADEYAFFLLFGKAQVTQMRGRGQETEVRWWYLRRLEYESRRGTVKGGVAQFYPIYIDNKTEKIIKIGEPLPHTQNRNTAPKIEGATTVFPIKDDGLEMNWGVTRETLKRLLDEGVVRVSKNKENSPQAFTIKYLSENYKEKINSGRWAVRGLREDNSKIVVETNGKITRASTVWTETKYDAKTYGTAILKGLIGDAKFSFPKSLYAVEDSIRYFLANKPNSLVIDFFAGSGTTLHAVNLLNNEDGGTRRCIMVTNNEVSETEAKNLKNSGFKPGDTEWEELGIARYVTWPRTICSIKGVDINGKPLKGEYFTSLTSVKEVERHFVHIDFIKDPQELTKTKKKKIVSIIADGNLPQKLVEQDSKYIVSDDEEHTVSILFDDTAEEEWLEALEGADHIKKIVIITASAQKFKNIKKRVNEVLGKIKVQEPIKIPMSDGFKANAAYFKLSFLDKNAVALGRQFRELLSVLWMKAGCVGACPVLSKDEDLPDMLVLPENSFAVLIDETKFSSFERQVNTCPEIKTVFIITDSGAGYRDMIANLNVENTYQLYRDYLDNFRINIGR